jgi:aminopeptidase N
MKDGGPSTIYLKNYTQSNFLIEKTDLKFELNDEISFVTSNLIVRKNLHVPNVDPTLVLHGNKNLQLLWVEVDGVRLEDDSFHKTDTGLSIPNMPDSFELSIKVSIKPQENTTMMGLYRSRTMFCTQCEAEGFRSITYFLDRPDVMSEYTTTIIADSQRYPILLSNGNLIDEGTLKDGKHYAIWNDPHKKPSYLFALVAGSLSFVEDSFKTMSGRNVALKIFVEEKDLNKCAYAMDALKRSMRWDEEKYGREYDLDIFMIVAVDDFNMGAMENKGLNIFNTSAVLVNPEISTDAAFQRVEAIVAHEYFHNWSGNRVTCRDWFQLSLKEGFTVFRDAQFSSDMNSSVVKRIEDVNFLRDHQFAEDSGPMAHSVQPDSYIEINNFYTVTIYEKGAEVVGMYHTLLGEDKFREATDLYFNRHDGSAATVEDFVVAMEDASGRNLNQFRRWYSQAGTPVVSVKSHYDSANKSYRLDFSQNCSDTPNQKNKKPFLIPIKLGLVSPDGEDIQLNIDRDNEVIFELSEINDSISFDKIDSRPVPSLLRGFSAPVKLVYEYSKEELSHLATHDSDGFSRWDAGNRLYNMVLLDYVDKLSRGHEPLKDDYVISVFSSILDDQTIEPAVAALMLQIPSDKALYGLLSKIDPHYVSKARKFARVMLNEALNENIYSKYNQLCFDKAFLPSAEQIGERSLKNTLLSYLVLDKSNGLKTVYDQFQSATNMTDKTSALNLLINHDKDDTYASSALADFYCQYKNENLVVNLWLQLQATNQQPGGLSRVQSLMEHESFSIKNPNKVRSLIGSFASSNHLNFHDKLGTGYEFLGEQILKLNTLNPQVAARLVTPLTRWSDYEEPYANLMKKQLKVIKASPGLVSDVYEVVTKSL